MHHKPRYLAPASLLSLVLIVSHSGAHAQTCCGGGPLVADCNVIWQPDDLVASCPAGDTLLTYSQQPHPSRLRIWIHYEDNFCNPRAKVPPDSIWATYQIISGNLLVNDKGTKIFADDSTDANGNTRLNDSEFLWLWEGSPPALRYGEEFRVQGPHGPNHRRDRGREGQLGR